MKKNKALLFLAAVVLSAFAAGCGQEKDRLEEEGSNASETGDTSSIDSTGTEETTSQLQLGSAVEIPESFDGKPAETDAHGQLEEVIADYCNVAQEDYVNVRYYYNYVDLNEDGKNEILALVIGQDVTGIDGNVLLWIEADSEGNMTAEHVRQSFRQVDVPIYISSHTTGGYRDLIITNNGNPAGEVEGEGHASGEEEVNAGNAGRTVDGKATSLEHTAGLDDTTGDNGAVLISLDKTYLCLVWKGKKYQTLEEATMLFNLDGLDGTAILINNVESDFASDKYHFLGEAM